MTPLFTALHEILGEEITTQKPLSGGDISNAYKITTRYRQLLLKINNTAHGHEMFLAEKTGLEAIAATLTVRTPNVVHCGAVNEAAILIMEYIESRQPGDGDLERLGQQLAQLHQVISHQYGWHADNFIGSLPQHNTWYTDWKQFYMTCRLLPQISMARDAGLLSSSETPGETRITKALEMLIGEVQPSLLHGDLWSGNYLISTDGAPYLIDPAVYYGHHEVDLAMTRLFGGFGERFYRAYAEVIPHEQGAQERNEIYQLYFLLVHLNLFGGAYQDGVVRTMKRHFG